MKLIAEFANAYEADLASLNYREKGILTYVSNRHSNNMRAITGANSVGLWVILDDQYSDAIELMTNQSHLPSTALSEDEMAQLEALSENQYAGSGSQMLSNLGVGAAIVILSGYILYISYGLLISR